MWSDPDLFLDYSVYLEKYDLASARPMPPENRNRCKIILGHGIEGRTDVERMYSNYAGRIERIKI